MNLADQFANTIVAQSDNGWADAIKILVGFVLALVIFYLQEKWRAMSQRRSTKKYCLKELEHNITVFEKCNETTSRLKQEIAVGKKTIYFDFKPENILYIFTQSAHSQGLFFDALSSEEIAQLNTDVLSFFGKQEFLTFVNSKITEYQSGQISASDLTDTLNFVESQAKQAVTILKTIKGKLKKQ